MVKFQQDNFEMWTNKLNIQVRRNVWAGDTHVGDVCKIG